MKTPRGPGANAPKTQSCLRRPGRELLRACTACARKTAVAMAISLCAAGFPGPAPASAVSPAAYPAGAPSAPGVEALSGPPMALAAAAGTPTLPTGGPGAAVATPATLSSPPLTLNELSRDRSVFDSGAHLLPLEKRKVLGLASTAGSRWQGPYKRPGTDRLPKGVRYDAGRRTVTVTRSFGGYLEGWDFTGNQLTWQSGEVKIRDCILGERDGVADILSYLDIYPAATVFEIAHNDIIGPNGYGGASPAILYRERSGQWPGVGGAAGDPEGWVHHNAFSDLTEDAIKPTGGLVEYNAIVYDRNLDYPGQDVDPHSDAINPRAITAPLTIRRNYIEMSGNPDYFKGANNAFRVVPNGPAAVPFRQALIYENVIIGAKGRGGFLFSAETKGMPDHVGPAYVGNWVRANDQKVLYPTYGADMIWTGNLDLDSGLRIGESEGRGTRDAVTPTNRADVPVSGTAPAGARIQARAVSVDDDGATTTGWKTVAVADGNGNWGGTLSAPRSRSWFRPEVRLEASPETTVQATNRFAAGHIWARWSQSDEYHIYAFDGTVTPEPVEDDDALQVVFLARDTEPRPPGSAALQRITAASPGKPGFAAMSNALAREFPGQKFMIGLHAHSGMGMDERVNEADNKRWKSDEDQIQDILTADGSKIGFVHEFFSSGTPSGLLTPAAMGPIQFGVNPDGSAFSAPGKVPSGRQTQRVDWTLTDFYDWSYTKMGFIVGYDDAARDRLRAMTQDPVYRDFFVVDPVGPRGYGGWLKGELSADGSGYTDTDHPGIEDPRGAAQMAAILIYAAMAQTGLTPGGLPVIDTIELHPNGDRKAVALGWSGGEMTTTRRIHGRPRLAGNPKYTDVKNIGWKGTGLRAEIRNAAGQQDDRGRIWLYKPDGSDWTAGDLTGIDLSFWADVEAPGDITNGWQFDDMPCGVVGAYGAVPVIPQSSPPDLFSNYTAYPPGRKRVATGGAERAGVAGAGPDGGARTGTGTPGTVPQDDNPNPNVAAKQVVAFDPAYWEKAPGFTPNGDGTLSVDLSTFEILSNKTAGRGRPRIDIDARATRYEIRVVVTSPGPGVLGQAKVQATKNDGYGAVEILGGDYKKFPGGNVPTELIWTTEAFAGGGRTQLKLHFRPGKGGSGIATISDLTVKAKETGPEQSQGE